MHLLRTHCDNATRACDVFAMLQGKWKFMKSKKPLMKPRLALVSIVEGKFKVSDVSLRINTIS
jgi:hypothetical protein